MKLDDLSSYLLWTRNYSPKWSTDLLLDNEKLVNTLVDDLLSKMGFVNVIKVLNIELAFKKGLVKIDPVTNQPTQKLKLFASLPDIYDNEALALPSIMSNKNLEEAGPAEMSVSISSILVYLCHDSILGFLLFASTAAVHISKAIQKIAKKAAKVTVPVDKDKKVFESVIKEEASEAEEEKVS